MAGKPKASTRGSAKQASEAANMTEDVQVNAAQTSAPEYTESHHGSRCGGVLRAVRERQGLSIQEIASRLRLSAKQIEALETDHFSSLPEATIVRGFIRNYAKQLKIAPEPLIEAYAQLVPGAAPPTFTLKPSSNMKVKAYKKANVKRYILLAGALALGVAVWLFYQNYVQKPNPISPSTSITPQSDIEPLPEIALPAAERANIPEDAMPITLPGADAAAPANTVPVPEPMPEPTPTAPVPAPEAVKLPVAPVDMPAINEMEKEAILTKPILNDTLLDLTPESNLAPAPAQPGEGTVKSEGAAKLEFNASQETWISVVDASGKEVYGKMLFAGNRAAIEVAPPANVVIGNALGATLVVNGKPMSLAPHTRTNVARIKIN